MLIRYPGTKGRFLETIIPVLERLLRHDIREYREPFFGGGAVGLALLRILQKRLRVWISDTDGGLSALWTSTIQCPDEIKPLIRSFVLTIEAFHEFKKDLLTDDGWLPDDMPLVGLKKLAIHRMSYSGLGTMSGGPLGGRLQTGNCKIDSRWNPERLCAEVDELHRLFLRHRPYRWECTPDDFEDVVHANVYTLLYCDPPYWHAGPALYQYSFTRRDHERLAWCLRKTHAHWLLSYDDCPEIWALYDWAHIVSIPARYSIAGSSRKTELLIVRHEDAEVLKGHGV